MTEIASLSPKDFQRKLYQDIDNKLKSTAWNSGASEAHGLLAGLACRGVDTQQVGNKMYLFQVANAEEIALLESLFEFILRDLNSDQFTFNLLLPDDRAETRQKAEALSNWCAGYLQGFCHDGESIVNECSESVGEIIRDLFDIGGINPASTGSAKEQDERSLMEIEEYLRVGIQLIYDELGHKYSARSSIRSSAEPNPQSTEIH